MTLTQRRGRGVQSTERRCVSGKAKWVQASGQFSVPGSAFNPAGNARSTPTL